MKHIHYRAQGNTFGIDPAAEDFWEIGPDLRVVRSITICANGTRLKYDCAHDADGRGALPEGPITEEMLRDTTVGIAIQISSEDFDAQWAIKSENEN